MLQNDELQIYIPQRKLWDNTACRFYNIPETTLVLKHTLFAVRMWESKWHKPFLHQKKMKLEEFIDYIKCMTKTENVDPISYMALTQKDINAIQSYIDNPMTATWFTSDDESGEKEIVTNEIIYYWMSMLHIPYECENWHLRTLLTLVRVCSEKQKPPKKLSEAEIMRRRRAENERRKKMWNTKG